MQKQTIYSYLQRALVKILSKSADSNKYKTGLIRPLKECSSPIASYALPIKKSKRIVAYATPMALQSQTLNFLWKVNTNLMPFLHVLKHYEHQPSLRFTCKFYLISFLKPRFGVLSKCYGRMLLNLVKQKNIEATKQKLIKLNQSLNNEQLLYYFRAKRLHTNFYPQTLRWNKKTVVCFCLGIAKGKVLWAISSPSCFYCLICSTLWAKQSSRHVKVMPFVFATLTLWALPLVRHGYAQTKPKASPLLLLDICQRQSPWSPCQAQRAWQLVVKAALPLARLSDNRRLLAFAFGTALPKARPGMATRGSNTTKRAPKTKAFLFVNPFEQKLCKGSTNFDFYAKQSQLVFRQSFYKRKNKSKNYRKIYQNLFYFFSFFSFTRNKEVCFFNSTELAPDKQAGLSRYAQQVLYLHKIEKQSIACCFQLLYFTSNNLVPLNTLQFLQNRTSITRAYLKPSFTTKRQEMHDFFLPLLCFLTIIFYISIKYIKQFNKQSAEPFQRELTENKKYKTFEFKKINDFNVISFKPFCSRLVVNYCAFNSQYFFLMRPLFSLTRLDTFFICESLKLPIYPDKSNLRVDFLRNRIRKQILPAIRILLNPQFDTILCKFYD